jgi:hypothetical protein
MKYCYTSLTVIIMGDTHLVEYVNLSVRLRSLLIPRVSFTITLLLTNTKISFKILIIIVSQNMTMAKIV